MAKTGGFLIIIIIISLDAKREQSIQSRIGQKAAVKEHFVLQRLTKS
jgi:hypothetical protein